MRGTDFLRILGRIGVIRNHMADDIQYILDEYQQIDESARQAQAERLRGDGGDDPMQNEPGRGRDSGIPRDSVGDQ